jgi:NAD(P)-dependent dehydrogenase (short-subunit alcohol dehydrogenase family)
MVLPMARDLARYGIRVNAIAPGVFRMFINISPDETVTHLFCCSHTYQ